MTTGFIEAKDDNMALFLVWSYWTWTKAIARDLRGKK